MFFVYLFKTSYEPLLPTAPLITHTVSLVHVCAMYEAFIF